VVKTLEGLSVDVAEPPRIVFDSPTRCADGRRAEELLRQELARANAPGHAWLVAMRIQETGPGALRADGDITDSAGSAVGHREFTGKASDCTGLARAVGVWASLVLDAEVRRPRVAQATSESAPTGSEPHPNSGRPPTTNSQTPSPTDPQPDVPLPSAPDEKPSRRDEPRTLEMGLGTFVMATSNYGVLIGGTPFLVVEVSKGIFIRPAVALGLTLLSGPPTTWAAARLDGCLRVAGQYTSRRGIQLDLCGGMDAGAVDDSYAGATRPYVAIGPSLDLRGELGGDLAVLLRGLGEVSLWQAGWAGRGELALSWRLQ
jgi:hypothetical protein